MTDFQFEYRGLAMGLGTPYHVTKVEGLEDDDVRMGDSEIPRGGGDIPGLHVASSRFVVMDIIVKGDAGSQLLRDRVQALIDVSQHTATPAPLYYQDPGMVGRRFVRARPAGRKYDRNPRTPSFTQFTMRLKLADPRQYEEFQNTGLLTNYDAAGGGLDFDITEFPKEYTVDTSSQTSVDNNGNAKAWPILQFFGPPTGTVTQVTLTNVSTGQAPTVLDTTILLGQTLTADMEAIATVAPSGLHVIRLGTVNQFTDWAQPRDPFYLQPGENTLRFEISGGTSTDATAAVTYRDTWL